jgi:hypothetical protein
MDAPEEVKVLAGYIGDLGYYVANANDLGFAANFSREGMDIREIITETLNAIAALGGTFHSPVSSTSPHKDSRLDGFEDPDL